MAEFVLLKMSDLRIAHGALVEFFKDDPEPMPGWSQADTALLETCCHCTEVTAYGEPKYPDLPQKAAKLLYSGVKLHAFPNGNKRFGVVITMLFLLMNGHTLEVERGELVRLATRIADSDPHAEQTKPERIVEELTGYIRERIKPDDRPRQGP